MKIDYSRVSFDEINTEDTPYFAWFNYEITQDEMDDWYANEVTDKEIPRGCELFYDMDLLLTIFSKDDFKLQAIVQDIKGNRYEVDLCEAFHNADEFIQLIPDYGKLKI